MSTIITKSFKQWVGSNTNIFKKTKPIPFSHSSKVALQENVVSSQSWERSSRWWRSRPRGSRGYCSPGGRTAVERQWLVAWYGKLWRSVKWTLQRNQSLLSLLFRSCVEVCLGFARALHKRAVRWKINSQFYLATFQQWPCFLPRIPFKLLESSISSPGLSLSLKWPRLLNYLKNPGIFCRLKHDGMSSFRLNKVTVCQKPITAAKR